MRSGCIKNLAEYITKSKSKDYLFRVWYYILLYATQYPPNVKAKLLKLVILLLVICHMNSLSYEQFVRHFTSLKRKFLSLP